jgi:hypothetical protein
LFVIVGLIPRRLAPVGSPCDSRTYGFRDESGMPKLAGIGGAATGHTPMGVAMYALGRIIQSPRWRTFSAIKKTLLANAIAAGDAATITKLVGVGASGKRAQQVQ